MAATQGQPSSLESKIEALKPDFSLKDQKRLRLDIMLRVARRLDALSIGCGACPGHLTVIYRLVSSVDNLDNWSLTDWKAYYRSLDDIIGHLKKAHRLVEEGDQMGIWMAIGAGLGTALGVALDSIVLGVALGVGGGLALGALLDAVAHKQGRVI